jgi:hypothetical protein
MKRSAALVCVAAGVLIASTAGIASNGPTSVAGGARIPPLYKNCTNLNKRYPHGVGKLLARDKTTGTPVRNFRRSTVLYRKAMAWNKRLDGDKDGIACEKK